MSKAILRKMTLLLVFCLASSVVAGKPWPKISIDETDRICDERSERCIEFGKVLFQRYQQQKQAEIRQKSQNYRLASKPVGMFHPRRTEYSALLIHGLNDSPFYMSDLGEVLFRQGFNVVTILLPGHGTDTREILETTAEQWQAEVETGLKMASLVGKKTIVGGFSLGGALAIDAVLRHPELQGLLLFAPAIRLPYFGGLYNLTCMSGLREISIPAKGPVNPVKYKQRMMNGVCQVYRLVSNQLETFKSYFPEKARRDGPLFDSASKVHVPVFGAMTYADARVSPEAIVDFFNQLDAPAMLTTFGSVPEDEISKTANRAEIVHISDQEIPHSYLVRKTNQYNGQANPYFDIVAQKLVGFLTSHL